MNTRWKNALGDQQAFIDNIPQLTNAFMATAKVDNYSVKTIRSFVASKDYTIADEPELFRQVVGAFAASLNDYYGYKLKVGGWFRKALVATNGKHTVEFWDLFNRCIFEGLNLAPEDEGLATPG